MGFINSKRFPAKFFLSPKAGTLFRAFRSGRSLGWFRPTFNTNNWRGILETARNKSGHNTWIKYATLRQTIIEKYGHWKDFDPQGLDQIIANLHSGNETVTLSETCLSEEGPQGLIHRPFSKSGYLLDPEAALVFTTLLKDEAMARKFGKSLGKNSWATVLNKAREKALLGWIRYVHLYEALEYHQSSCDLKVAHAIRANCNSSDWLVLSHNLQECDR